MNIDNVNIIFQKVRDIILNNRDYLYLSKLHFKTVKPDIVWANSILYHENLIKAFATYVPDSATAEEYAHYIISCMAGAAAIDAFLDYLLVRHIKFNIQSTKGYTDEIIYMSIKPARFHQDDARIAGTLFAYTLSVIPVVKFEFIFTWRGGTDYKYLEQPVTIKVQTDSTKQGEVLHTTVRQLNTEVFQTLLNQITW